MTITRRKRHLQASTGTTPTSIERGAGCSRTFVNTDTGERFDIDELHVNIPARIDRFIDNKAYRRKYAAMITQGRLPYLLALADKAATREFPANYFAKCCAKDRWASTRANIISQGLHARYQPLGGIPNQIDSRQTSIEGGSGWQYGGPGDHVYIPDIPAGNHALRFWSKTRFADHDRKFDWRLGDFPPECIEWTGKPDKDGYGRFRADGRTWAAHRFAYVLHYGFIPDGLQVEHRCRNRMCVNPLHLESVTQAVNLSRRQFGSPPPAARVLSAPERRSVSRSNRASRQEIRRQQRQFMAGKRSPQFYRSDRDYPER